MTGWKRLDTIIAWCGENPDRVFYLGLVLYLLTCIGGL